MLDLMKIVWFRLVGVSVNLKFGSDKERVMLVQAMLCYQVLNLNIAICSDEE
jgi:hypothetical protein